MYYDKIFKSVEKRRALWLVFIGKAYFYRAKVKYSIKRGGGGNLKHPQKRYNTSHSITLLKQIPAGSTSNYSRAHDES